MIPSRSGPLTSMRVPLMRAEEHIRLSGLAPYIETRLSDGLEKLGCGEADSVLVAGMGGPLIIRILSKGKRQLAGVRELIVQPSRRSVWCGISWKRADGT